jgi:hypothetical protein
MRSRRRQKQRVDAARLPAPREIVIPGLAGLQAREEHLHDYETDPSYIDRQIDKDAWEYLSWWRTQASRST